MYIIYFSSLQTIPQTQTKLYLRKSVCIKVNFYAIWTVTLRIGQWCKRWMWSAYFVTFLTANISDKYFVDKELPFKFKNFPISEDLLYISANVIYIYIYIYILKLKIWNPWIHVRPVGLIVSFGEQLWVLGVFQFSPRGGEGGGAVMSERRVGSDKYFIVW